MWTQTFLVMRILFLQLFIPWTSAMDYPSDNFLHDQNLPLTCLDGRTACGSDTNCQRMLSVIPELCPRPGSCDPDQHQQCRAVQTWLSINPFFKDCHCRLNELQTPSCIELRDSIMVDPCPEVYATKPPDKSDQGYYRTKPHNADHIRHRKEFRDSHYEYSDGEDIDATDYEEGPHEMSCIGVRKLCLINEICRQTFSDFRRLCRENKKQNECVATDQVGCFDMIQKLRPSGVFECTCPVKKPQTKMKCDRIQYRLANNTCLVTVPYILYSTRTLAASYDELLSVVSDSRGPSNSAIFIIPVNNSSHLTGTSTCVSAFNHCNEDPTCHLKMAAYMNACQWNENTHLCNKEHCLAAIRSFYLLVRPEFTHDLLFCQCEKDDYKCEAVRQALYPTCATIEMPPPKCHEIITRCEQDHDCRRRWASYEEFCRYDKITGGCSKGTAMCRNAQVGIMGTVLNTNCTCAFLEDEELKLCQRSERRLKHDNICKELAQKDFARQQMKTTTVAPQNYWKDAAGRKDCLRHLGHRTTSFMDIPAYVRVYRNDSDCSDLCSCAVDGNVICRNLPCQLPLDCRDNHMNYAHGENFVRPDRGLCRCIKSEIVCARAKKLPYRQRTGLFLHVGYSIADRNLVEEHSSIKFQPETVTSKLSDLLNKDTVYSLCKMSVYHEEPGNLVFSITLTKYESSPADIRKTCLAPTQVLGAMINDRQGLAVADAELSIIKVAESEMLQRSSRPLQSSTNHHAPIHAAAPSSIPSTIALSLSASIALSSIPTSWLLLITYHLISNILR